MSIFNFEKDVKKMSFEAPAEGEYELLLEKAEFKTSSTGNPMYSLVWVITSGEYMNRKIFDNLVLIPSCAFKFVQVMDGMGVTVPNEMEMSDIELLFSQDSEECLIGETVNAKLKHVTYNGVKRATIHYYIRAEDTVNDENDEPDPFALDIDETY